MSAPFIGDCDFSTLYFTPLVTVKRCKSVSVYCNDENTTWANRVCAQLSPDEDYPIAVKYFELPRRDQDPTRLNMKICLDSVTHETTINKLEDIDREVYNKAVESSNEWWGRTIDEDTIALMHKPLLEWRDDCYMMKLKVIVPHPNPEPGKKYSRPTLIFRLHLHGYVTKEDHTILLKRGVQVVPSVSSPGVWFLGDNAFGMTMKAEVLLVITRPVHLWMKVRRYVSMRRYALYWLLYCANMQEERRIERANAGFVDFDFS